MEQQKSFSVTLLLSFFLGCFGIHRFYTGYTAIGIMQLLTMGGCGIWTFIDFINICLNNYKDAKGQELKEYNKTMGLTFLAIAVVFTILTIISKLS